MADQRHARLARNVRAREAAAGDCRGVLHCVDERGSWGSRFDGHRVLPACVPRYASPVCGQRRTRAPIHRRSTGPMCSVMQCPAMASVQPASELIWGLVSRGVGLVFLIAFLSLAPQVLPIAGRDGLLPIEE